jgi:hypothetical protein
VLLLFTVIPGVGKNYSVLPLSHHERHILSLFFSFFGLFIQHTHIYLQLTTLFKQMAKKLEHATQVEHQLQHSTSTKQQQNKKLLATLRLVDNNNNNNKDDETTDTNTMDETIDTKHKNHHRRRWLLLFLWGSTCTVGCLVWILLWSTTPYD